MRLRQLFSFDLKSDLRASIVVFLVALPLAMGVSIASGYPPAAGLITGVIGGIAVGLISGAPLQVSGAAAGLTVVVFQGVQEYGLARMGLVVLLAGLMQAAAGISGFGRWFQAVSPTVLHGMLAGIGILIVASQFHVMLDLAPMGSGIANIFAIPNAVTGIFSAEKNTGLLALALGLLSIAVMLAWPKLARGKLNLLPAPLVSVVLCAGVAWIGSYAVNYVNIPQNLFSSWTFGSTDFGAVFQTPMLIGAALQLALIASAESLLCAAAVDQMHTGPRAKFNKELTAQGIGNALCGLVGSIPMTGVIVRSSANVVAGASSRLSTMLHGVWLLLFVVLLPHVLDFVPIAALAGILVYTGLKLVNIKEVKHLYHQGRSELVIYLATVTVIVSYDLLAGVVLGLVMSSLKVLRQLSHLSISVHEDKTRNKIIVTLGGAATFLRLPKLAQTLESIPPRSKVEIKSDLRLMDSACEEHFNLWKKLHQKNGGDVEFATLSLSRN